MNDPDFMSQTLPVWMAALIALVLLVSVNGVARALNARGFGGVVRFYRGIVYFLIPLLLLLPPIMIETPRAAVNIGLLFYTLFFSGFCYHLGKRLGWSSGRRNLSEFIGMETPENLEDTQDRLFESRLRFPHRGDVVKSIGDLARAADAAREIGGADNGHVPFNLKR